MMPDAGALLTASEEVREQADERTYRYWTKLYLEEGRMVALKRSQRHDPPPCPDGTLRW